MWSGRAEVCSNPVLARYSHLQRVVASLLYWPGARLYGSLVQSSRGVLSVHCQRIARAARELRMWGQPRPGRTRQAGASQVTGSVRQQQRAMRSFVPSRPRSRHDWNAQRHCVLR